MNQIRESAIPSSLMNESILKLSKTLVQVFGFALLTALAAQIKIPLPFTPVPMTLQTLIVVMAGLFLGRNKGAISQALYLGLGLAGAPFFAGSIGFTALSSPKIGYLIGFIPSAYLAGFFAEWSKKKNAKRFSWIWLAALVASLPTLGLGTIGLKLVLGLSWSAAFALGLAPFILGDLVKTTIAATGYLLVKK